MIDLRHGISKIEERPSESKVYRARRGSWSLKTTVPDWIVNCLNLEAGNTLEWRMVFRDEGPPLAVISRGE